MERVDRPPFVMPVVADALWVLEALFGPPPGVPLFPNLLATVLGALEPPLKALLDVGTAWPPPIAVIWLPFNTTPSHYDGVCWIKALTVPPYALEALQPPLPLKGWLITTVMVLPVSVKGITALAVVLSYRGG